MKVIATQRGYYGSKRRDPGEAFGLTDAKHFSATWMERADGKPVAAVETAGEPAPVVKLKAAERIALAKELTGRDDITTAKEADAILASAEAATAPVEPFSDDAPIEAVED